eukprot:COSAG05_NODE_157_length_15666_cov_29.830410_4_plen_89_part_00
MNLGHRMPSHGMTGSLTLESGGCFDLLKIGQNQNNDLDSPHLLSIMSAIYPIRINCIAISSRSMSPTCNLYIFILIKGVEGGFKHMWG